MSIDLTITVDGWISEEGLHIFCEDQEEIISFFKMANDFIDSQCVPSPIPTIRDSGRENIMKLSNILEATAAYLRKQANEIRDWDDYMGHRD